MTAMKSIRTSVRTRLAAGSVIAMLAFGTAACESDSAGPEAGGVTTDDLQQLQDQVDVLEERIGVLEGQTVAGAEPTAGEGEQDIIGQEVTISAEISELITFNDAGTAFRIGGDGGPSVAVLAGSATVPELEANDVVQISGTVLLVNRDNFEQDFGIVEDDLFDDPDAFFTEFEGQPAITADSVEVLQEQATEGN